MIEIFILSIIQGITEFLPISSSSHLILVSQYINFENQGLSIDVSLHIGSFFAVVVYFKKDILNFVKNKDLFFKIFLSSIPVMFVGFIIVQFNLIDQLRNIKIIGWTTIIFGVLDHLLGGGGTFIQSAAGAISEMGDGTAQDREQVEGFLGGISNTSTRKDINAADKIIHKNRLNKNRLNS